MRSLRRAIRILAQPVAELPESPDGPARRPGQPEPDDGSASRYWEEPYTSDPALPGDKRRPSFLSDGRQASAGGSAAQRLARSLGYEVDASGDLRPMPARTAATFTLDQVRSAGTPEDRERWGRISKVCAQIGAECGGQPWFGGLGVARGSDGRDEILFDVDASAPAAIQDTETLGVRVRVNRMSLSGQRATRRTSAVPACEGCGRGSRLEFVDMGHGHRSLLCQNCRRETWGVHPDQYDEIPGARDMGGFDQRDSGALDRAKTGGRMPRRAFDQPRLEGGEGDEIIHTLTEDGDQETRTTDRLSGYPKMHAWRCAACHIAIRTAKCLCPTRCPGCGGTHLRADVTRERGKTREGGPTETAYRQSMGEHDLEAPSNTPSVS